jgi:hypothetical protein
MRELSMSLDLEYGTNFFETFRNRTSLFSTTSERYHDVSGGSSVTVAYPLLAKSWSSRTWYNVSVPRFHTTSGTMAVMDCWPFADWPENAASDTRRPKRNGPRRPNKPAGDMVERLRVT